MLVHRHRPVTEMHAIRRREVQCSASCADGGPDGQSTSCNHPLSRIPTFCQPAYAPNRPVFRFEDLPALLFSTRTPFAPFRARCAQRHSRQEPWQATSLLLTDRAAPLPTLPLFVPLPTHHCRAAAAAGEMSTAETAALASPAKSADEAGGGGSEAPDADLPKALLKRIIKARLSQLDVAAGGDGKRDFQINKVGVCTQGGHAARGARCAKLGRRNHPTTACRVPVPAAPARPCRRMRCWPAPRLESCSFTT